MHQVLMVKAKERDGGWHVMEFDLSKPRDFRPNVHLKVERAIRAANRELVTLWCRNLAKGDEAVVLGVNAQNEVVFYQPTHSLKEILSLAKSALRMRYGLLDLDLRFPDQTGFSEIVRKLNYDGSLTSKALLTGVELTIVGTDPNGWYELELRYALEGKFKISLPKLRTGTPEKLANMFVGHLDVVSKVKWKYSYPTLKLKVKGKSGSIYRLTLDLSDLARPAMKERREYKPSWVNIFRWILP